MVKTILRWVAAFLASGALVGLNAAKEYFEAHAPQAGASVDSWIYFGIGAAIIAGAGWLVKKFGPSTTSTPS